jgi:O-antigen/teichoic acid export membrane protein
MSFVVSMRMGGIALQLGWFMLLVRLLPLEAVGYYSVVNSFWLLLRALGPLGHDSALIREGGALVKEGHYPRVRGLLQAGILYSLSRQALLIFTLLLLAYGFASEILPFDIPLLLAIGVGAIGYMLFGFYSASMLVLERQIAAHALESLALPLGTILIALGLWLGGNIHFELLIMAQACYVLLLCLVYAFMVRRYFGRQLTAPDAGERLLFHALAWRIFGTLALNNLNVRVPVLISPFLIGAAGTALLETALRFAALLGIIQWCTGFVIGPKLPKAKDDPVQLQALLIIGCWLVALPALMLYLFFAGAGEWMLAWLAGKSYQAAYLPLLLVALGYFLNAASGPTSHYFLMLGHERESFYISLVETVLTLLLLIMLGIYVGILGMAIAIAVGLGFRNLWLNLRLKPLTGLHPGIWSPEGVRGMVTLLQQLRGRLS